MSIDKPALVRALREAVETQLVEAERATSALADGLRVDGDHRPANRGERAAVTSAGYLAKGLGERKAELEAVLENLDRLSLADRPTAVTGAVVVAEDGRRWFLFPGAAGLVVDGVAVISPGSPVGKALWGLEEGDEAELLTGPVELVEVR